LEDQWSERNGIGSDSGGGDSGSYWTTTFVVITATVLGKEILIMDNSKRAWRNLADIEFCENKIHMCNI